MAKPLSKWEWGEACRFAPMLRNSPGPLRLSWLLCQLYNEDVNCAFPSRGHLALMLGASEVSVSRWIAHLKSCGAISVCSLGILPASARKIIGRTASRSQVYLLNFGWAGEVISLRDEVSFERQIAKVSTQTPLGVKGVQSGKFKVSSQTPLLIRDELEEEGAGRNDNLPMPGSTFKKPAVDDVLDIGSPEAANSTGRRLGAA